MLLASEGLLGCPSLLSIVLAGGVLYVLMVGFFAVVVLPRSTLAAHRVGLVRRDWALSAAVYLVVLVPIVAIGSALV